MSTPYFHYETLRPDQLEVVVRESPVAYWPLGLLEHHGWHLPIGFDGIKAKRLCEACAGETGGVVLPVMWWGGSGGHGEFKWTHYQNEEAAGEMVLRTVRQLVVFGFRTIVLLCGHYPWEGILETAGIGRIETEEPGVRIIYGNETDIANAGVSSGDHAARQETNYGLHLLPELVDMGALTDGRDQSAWPHRRRPEDLFPGLHADPSQAQFSQLGEDASLATAQDGASQTARIVDGIVERVKRALNDSGSV